MGFWIYREANAPSSVVSAQTAMGGGPITLATGQIVGRGDASALYMYDSDAKKLAVLMMNNNSLELLAVRDMQYDWQVVQFSPKSGKQVPTVEEIKSAVNKRRKKG